MSAQGDDIPLGQGIPRRSRSSGRSRQDPSYGSAGPQGHGGTRTIDREQEEMSDARGGDDRGQTDPMLRQLVELLTAATARQTRESERVGTYTITDYLKLVRATKDMGTTYFDGEPDPMKADEWLEKLEENFETTLCPAEYKKNIAAYFLQKEAKAWWKATERQFGDTAVTWDLFKSEFLRKYFPSEARDRLERQFLNLTQGGGSVREYEAQFTRLRRFVYRGQDDERTMMRYFLNGLKPDLSSRLAVVDFPNLNRMIERAADVEEKMNQVTPSNNRVGNTEANRSVKSKTGSFRSQPAPTQFSGKGSTQTGNRPKSGAKSSASITCFKCGNIGHYARECTGTKKRPAPDSVTCFKCSEKGHYASSCPNRTTTSGISVNRPQSEASKAQPAAKKKATESRVYALNVDEPESSNPKKGPVAGM